MKGRFGCTKNARPMRAVVRLEAGIERLAFEEIYEVFFESCGGSIRSRPHQ